MQLENLAREDQMETQDHRDLLVLQVYQVDKESKGNQVNLDHQVKQADQDLQELGVNVVFQV